MKVVILAGGFGTRLAEETEARPKPLVEIGGRPILWHIMKSYLAHGFSDFIVCLGYKSGEIKRFFYDQRLHDDDITVDMATREVTYHNKVVSEPWRVTLVETGLHTMTGGRIRAIRDYLEPDQPFLMTYGDGVADIDIAGSVAFHRAHGRLATVTAVMPPGRFGVLELGGDRVTGFREKIAADQYRINAGYFVLNPKVIDHIDGPATVWEQEPMRKLAESGEMMAYQHNGFWQPMDTLRDKRHLEDIWISGAAPWKVWKE